MRSVAFFALGLLAVSAQASKSGEINKVDFKPGKESSTLVLHFEGKGKFRVLQSERQGSVVLEADNFALPARLTRAIDASATESQVLQVTPYSSGTDKQPRSKFVLQLKGRADVVTNELPGRFVMEIRRRPLVTEVPGRRPAAAPRRAAVRDELKLRDSAGEKSQEVAKQLVAVLNAPEDEKQYFGSRISFEGNQVEVHDIFRLVGEASGLNIITDEDVKYQSNYSLKDIPWDQLLDIVVQQAQLKAAVTGNVVRIVTLQKFNSEQEAKLREIDIADEMEPVVMAVIPLSFATAEEMKRMIETLLIKRDRPASARVAAAQAGPGPGGPPGAPDGQPGAGGAEGGGRFIQDFVRGEIQVDSRSNSLVVTNTKDTIERIRKLVQELDVPLPQVLIDAKIVIATEEFTRNLGMRWGGRATSSGSGRAGIAGGFGAGDLTLGDAATNAPAFSVSSPEGAGGIGFQVGAGRHGFLNTQLQLSEVNGTSRTVASPRVIVNNKKTAKVVDGQTLLIGTSGGVGTAGQVETIQAALDLTVTPQVTSVGSVLLDVSIKKDQPGSLVAGSATVENKQMETQVLVDSGSTLVLGGVYQFGQAWGEKGIPLLKDLPFIGQLFRENTETRSKGELMVFITPQIIEVSERGTSSF
jgi:type IV pilus assembly protein PilQ